MTREIHSMLEIIDDLYTLAYWMTGAEISAHELVSSTYWYTGLNASAHELFITFRACYQDRCRVTSSFCVSDSYSQLTYSSGVSLRQRVIDMKLLVLLYEISGLNHRDISEITGTSLDALACCYPRGKNCFLQPQC